MSSDFDISKGKYWQRPLSLVDGCTPCSPGCERCWSAGIRHRFHKNDRFLEGKLTNEKGQFNGNIITRHNRLDIPLKRRKPTVWAIWNDLLHPAVPFEFVAQTMDVICDERCENDTFLLVTKRVERWKEFRYWHGDCWSGDTPFSVTLEALGKIPNLWVIPTICNQEEADRIIPELLQIDEANRGISIEPMLGLMDIHYISTPQSGWLREYPIKNINAVILGGENGTGARPMHPDGVRSVRDQCQTAGVPFFFKGWGTQKCRCYLNVKAAHRVSKGLIAGYECAIHDWGQEKSRLLDSRTHDDLPWRTA